MQGALRWLKFESFMWHGWHRSDIFHFWCRSHTRQDRLWADCAFTICVVEGENTYARCWYVSLECYKARCCPQCWCYLQVMHYIAKRYDVQAQVQQTLLVDPLLSWRWSCLLDLYCIYQRRKGLPLWLLLISDHSLIRLAVETSIEYSTALIPRMRLYLCPRSSLVLKSSSILRDLVSICSYSST